MNSRDVDVAAPAPSVDLLALDEALAKLEAQHPVKARIIKLRDPAQAVVLDRKSVEKAPAAKNLNTLGVAYYCAGDWNAAIGPLKKAESLGPDKSLAFNGFFLAMARWQMGEKDEARKWFDRSDQWMEKNRPDDAELRRFRAEAEELLGLATETKSKQKSAPKSTP
jgi:tetratricopeptide (TPR) repeat protein